MTIKQLHTLSLLPLAYEVRGKAMISLCLSVHRWRVWEVSPLLSRSCQTKSCQGLGLGNPQSFPDPVWPSPVRGRGTPRQGPDQGGTPRQDQRLQGRVRYASCGREGGLFLLILWAISSKYVYLQSGLEKEIDNAIERGEFSTAEKLSDRLATREVC